MAYALAADVITKVQAKHASLKSLCFNLNAAPGERRRIFALASECLKCKPSIDTLLPARVVVFFLILIVIVFSSSLSSLQDRSVLQELLEKAEVKKYEKKVR